MMMITINHKTHKKGIRKNYNRRNC